MTDRIRWVCPVCQKAYAVPSIEGLTRCPACASDKSLASKKLRPSKPKPTSINPPTSNVPVAILGTEGVAEAALKTWRERLLWVGLWAVPLLGVAAAIGFVVIDSKRRAEVASDSPSTTVATVPEKEAEAEAKAEPIPQADPPQYYDGPVGIIRTLAGHNHSVLSVAFSPDGQYIASGSHDQSVRVWSVDGELLQTLNYVTQVAPSFSLRGGTRDILRGMIARGLGLR